MALTKHPYRKNLTKKQLFDAEQQFQKEKFKKCIIIHAYMSSQCGFPFWGPSPKLYLRSRFVNFFHFGLVGVPPSLQVNRGFSVL